MMTSREERAYLQGQQMLASQLLSQLRPSLPKHEAQKNDLLSERSLVKMKIEDIGRMIGAEEWTENLCLVDVLDKYIIPKLLEDGYHE